MSASGYINRVRVRTLAQASKVQFDNHVVFNNISNGVIPCIPDLNPIVYIPNPPCQCEDNIVIITLIDGGFPEDNYPFLDCGFPETSGRVIDCGVI